MPTSAPHFCARAGCPNLTTARYCQDHQGQRERLYDHHRGSSAARGYDSKWYAWLERYRTGEGLDLNTPEGIQALVDRNRCRHCAQHGLRVTRHLEFDHITPLEAGGARLDANNVQPLCKACHNRKTAHERMKAGCVV